MVKVILEKENVTSTNPLLLWSKVFIILQASSFENIINKKISIKSTFNLLENNIYF